MIKKIIVFTIPFCFIIAVALFLMGYERVELGSPFYDFMRKVSMDFENWKLQIPEIPELPNFDGEWYSVLVEITDALIKVVNFTLMVVNFLIQMVQFIFTIIYEVFAMLKTFEQPSDNSFVGVRAF